jgi:photosystem II stability/assembly factor-like uncharacterized protein
LLALPGQSEEKVTPRDQQIAELEKQINELKKKLSQLQESNGGTVATAEGPLPNEWIKALTWRSIGPANMGGRITAISVFETDPSTYYVATASGGLLKTVNNGITFEHQFDHENTVSIGDVCVAPSDRNIVWVGSGEAHPRNSVSYGDGVYKSTDGGKTWKNMGLKKSFQIGRIRIHPANPNIVYVGALGRLYGPNEERGLFKTTNGGETWDKILYVDDKTGVLDINMHPTEPDTLLVATYERQRDSYDTNDPSKRFGPGAALYKTTDGGKTFKKLTKGLPTCPLGRIGIEFYRKNPNTIYIILESEKIGGPPRKAPAGGEPFTGMFGFDGEDPGARVLRVLEGSPAEKAGIHQDDVVIAFGGKAVGSFAELNDLVSNHKVDDKVKVKIRREGKEQEVELTLVKTPEDLPFGRRASDPNRPFGESLGGQIPNVQERQGADGFQYGGIYKSTDGGESWTRINSLNPRPMYFSQIRVDPNDDNYQYVLGVSLYRSTDGGKTFRPDGGRGVHADQHALWINPRDSRHMIVGCDGGFYVTYDRMANWDHLNHLALGQFYHVAVDPRPRYNVYGGLQDNGTWGGPNHTRTATGPINEDWFSVGGGDGYRCAVDPNDPDLIYWESQNGGFGRRNLRTGEAVSLRSRPARGATDAPPGSLGGETGSPRPPQGPQYRFNWNSPFILSHHNSRIYYNAGNFVFRSLDRGNDLRIISPEITRTNKGSATALAESPRNPNVLYAGTDDGYLWVTMDGGKEWKNITANVGLPAPHYVATIEASRYAEGRAYVVFDAHREDDDNPYVYVTEDFGKTWKSLRANLPWGSTRCLREDIQNQNLLYLGTEFAAWASIDRGSYWTKINNNLPTVAVHEFAQHPTAGEMVAATHGRSLWILDVTPLRQMTIDVVKDKAHLYQPNKAVNWRLEPTHGRTNRRFVGQNPPPGAQIFYSLTQKAEKVNVKIVDYMGKTVREFNASSEPGLHKVAWNLALTSPRPGGGAAGAAPAGAGTEPGAGPARRGGGGARRQGAGGPPAGTPAGGPASGGPPGGAQAGGRQGGEQPGGGPPGGGPGGPGGFGRGGFGRGFGGGQLAAPGMYRVVLTVDGKEFTQSLRVEADPSAPTSLIAEEDDDGDPGVD